MRRGGTRVLAAAGALLLAAIVANPAAAYAMAQQEDWVNLRSARQVGSIDAMTAEITYAAGELTIESAAEGLLYEASLRYDSDRFSPQREWTVQGQRGLLVLDVMGDRDLSLDLKDLKRDIREGGSLRFALSPNVPTDLKLKMGAVKADLRLGGVPLTQLEIHAGAAEIELRFDAPNPEVMRQLNLEVGAAKFVARGLGNASPRKLSFEGGVGEVTLDLTGEWSESADIDIEMGLGALTLRLPENVGVRIQKTTFLVAFDAGGLEKVDGDYVSSNWDTADIQLRIQLKAALGAIDIDFER